MNEYEKARLVEKILKEWKMKKKKDKYRIYDVEFKYFGWWIFADDTSLIAEHRNGKRVFSSIYRYPYCGDARKMMAEYIAGFILDYTEHFKKYKITKW